VRKENKVRKVSKARAAKQDRRASMAIPVRKARRGKSALAAWWENLAQAVEMEIRAAMAPKASAANAVKKASKVRPASCR
jgi:hypothetical protein